MSGTTIIAQISMLNNIICHIFLFNNSRCITFYIGEGHTCICLSARWRFHLTFTIVDLPILIVYPLSGAGGRGGGFLLPFTPKIYQEFQAPQKIKISEILAPLIRKDPKMPPHPPPTPFFKSIPLPCISLQDQGHGS